MVTILSSIGWRIASNYLWTEIRQLIQEQNRLVCQLDPRPGGLVALRRVVGGVGMAALRIRGTSRGTPYLGEILLTDVPRGPRQRFYLYQAQWIELEA